MPSRTWFIWWWQEEVTSLEVDAVIADAIFKSQEDGPFCINELTSGEGRKREKILLELNRWNEIDILNMKFLINLLRERKVERLSEIEIKAIEARINENHPMYDILLLEEWDDICNFTFSGIKDMNDIYGQPFVDEIVSRFKQEVLDKNWFEVVWTNYTTFLLKWETQSLWIDEKSLQDKLDEIFRQVSKENKKSEESENTLKVNFLNSKVPKTENQREKIIFIADFIEQIAKNGAKKSGDEFVELDEIENLEEEFYSEYRANCSQECQALNRDWEPLGVIDLDWRKVYSDETKTKQVWFIKWRFVFDKEDGEWEQIWFIEWKPIYSTKLTDENGQPKQVWEVVNWFYYQFYEVDWKWEDEWKKFIRREMVRLFDDNWKPDQEIMDFIRKKELYQDTDLYWDLKKIINSYELNWKSILPFLANKKLLDRWIIMTEEEMKRIKNLKSFLRNPSVEDFKPEAITRQLLDWELEEWEEVLSNNYDYRIKYICDELDDLILNNYKWFLDKKSFPSQVAWKKWKLMFVDIISMSVQNLLNIRKNIHSYFKAKNHYSELEDNWANERQLSEARWKAQKAREDIWIYSVHQVTSRMIDSANEIKNIDREEIPDVWNIEIWLWWDEITMFFEEKDWEDTPGAVLHDIVDEELDINDFLGRISLLDIDKVVKSPWGISRKLEDLDKSTQLSKVLEKRLASLKKMLSEMFSSDLQRSQNELLGDFRIEVEIWWLGREDSKVYALGQDNVQYNIVFQQNPFWDGTPKDNKFEIRRLFEVKEVEKWKYAIHLRKESPLITRLDKCRLWRDDSRAV